METWITMSKILSETQNMILFCINNIINKIKFINPDHGERRIYGLVKFHRTVH